MSDDDYEPVPQGDESRQGYTLIVAPHGADRDFVVATLQRAGMEVAAGTEYEVVTTHDLVPPRLIVLDDIQKRAGRTETQAKLLAHPPLIGVPLVVLAYDSDIDSYSDAVTGGAAAYLVKPVSAEELALVAQKLSGWRGQSEKTEKRRRTRRPLLMRIDVDLRAQKRRVPGQLVDASGTGCRVELEAQVEPGELVRVVLHGHEGSTHVALGAEVRWHRLAPDGTHVAGLRFTGSTAILAGRLLGFASAGMGY